MVYHKDIEIIGFKDSSKINGTFASNFIEIEATVDKWLAKNEKMNEILAQSFKASSIRSSSSFSISNSIGLFSSLGQSSAHRMRLINRSSTTSSFEGQQVSEKELSAMERLKEWLHQQTAKILGDVQEPEPVEDPSPMRAGCRIFFMVSLLLGFASLLAYTFNDAPDAWADQIHRLTSGDKNHAFPSCFLYERNSPNCTKWSKAKFPEGIPVSCRCTNTSAPWKNFVKFYILHENSTDWNMNFTMNPYLTISLPDDSIRLGNEYIVKGTEFLTAEEFCNLSYLWPIAEDSASSSGTIHYEMENVTHGNVYPVICNWMATVLFPGSNKEYEDRTRSTQFLNTQSLLNREELNMHLAKLARESVLRRRLTLETALPVDVANEKFRRYYNTLARFLTKLLDRDEMDPSESYVHGATDLSHTLTSNRFYDKNTTVWILKDDSGSILFLQSEIDWEAYHEACSPKYCDVTLPMQGARKWCWVFGILGGGVTIILAIVTMLLWPCTAMLLHWISRRKTVEKGEPIMALVGGPQPVELSIPLESKTLNP